jgi:hypothetical protein
MPKKPEVYESNRLRATLAKGSVDYPTSYSLNMIAPITSGVDPDPGGLLALWEDVSLAQLPPTVRAFALSQTPPTPREILKALLEPSAIAESCADLIDVARRLMTQEFGARSAEVSLLRAGLLTDSVPTLEEIGRQFALTRERVRQLEKQGEGIVETAGVVAVNQNGRHLARLQSHSVGKRHGAAQKLAEQVNHQPLAHTLRAWFDLNPRRPLTDKEITILAGSAAGSRCCGLVLEILQYPSLSCSGKLWFKTGVQRRAGEVILATSESWTGATSWHELAARIRGQMPGVERVLDLEPTLRLMGDMRGLGVGLDGRILNDRSRLTWRVARKIVTYLRARVTPVPIDELAKTISSGQIPFHVFQRSPVTLSWLRECVQSAESLLVQLKDGSIALAPSLAGRPPTGMVGILYSIVVRHGEPIRMQDLCDKARAFGLSRNQASMLIHSRRAACLFMLNRGIVGLVGRDEGANSAEYEAAKPHRVRNTVRPGHEIGCDDGALIGDIQVRRSVREQGLGLPWPFSLALLDAASQLKLDDERAEIARKPNGDLDVPELIPGSGVRIALSRGRRGCILSINTKRRSEFDPIHLKGPGAPFPLRMPPSLGRPGWVAEFERRHDGKLFPSLTEVFSALPAPLAETRRVYALHGFLALGIVHRTSKGWKVVEGQELPASITAAFKQAEHDPFTYPALLGDDRAAVVWLVRAAWLTPNLGWTLVRPNDLSQDIELDPLLSDAAAPRSVGVREAALMRVVETAEQAADWLAHPGEHDSLDQTVVLARRYLTALGYTGYRAVREVARTKSGPCIAYGLSAEGVRCGVWLLKPVGTPIGETDSAAARREARRVGALTWGVTNALRLQGAHDRHSFDLDLGAVARNEEIFEQLIQLAATPSDFKRNSSLEEDEGDE